MKAAMYYGRRDIRIEDVPEPEAGPGQVKVRVEWCGICGTDLHEYLDGPIFCPPVGAPHALTGEQVPVALGHEFAGAVADVGDGVTNVAVGDRVAVEPYLTCGRCARCPEGRYNVCDVLGFIGLSGGGGGFDEYVVADARRTFPIGGLGTDIGALVEPLAVAYHAVRLGGVRPGMTATVFGSGPIGLVTTAALRAAGAAEIVGRAGRGPQGQGRRRRRRRRARPDRDRRAGRGARAHRRRRCRRRVRVRRASTPCSARRSARCAPAGTVVNVAIWGHPASGRR